MIYGASDLPVMLADFGVPVVFEGRAFKGLLDQRDEPALGLDGQGEVIVRTIQLTVATSDVPGIREGRPITADGQTFTVRERLSLADAALTRLLLRRA